ncbi:MAG: three-Cys-motif partner protein TcmP [Gemmataceae bacterium]|nr:three-Cys-motif partner protein TcmP [Gemmataceae bacterium]
MSEKQQPYGGYWTQVKLERVRRYLEAFTEEMEGESFKTIYIDAFAGSGIVTMPKPERREGGFRVTPVSDKQPCIEGSALQSLRIPKVFDNYIFNELSPQCCRKLRQRVDSRFPFLRKRVRVECKDANAFLVDELPFMDWTKQRAVVFLDSFGPVVHWDTIKTIANTGAADLLYMFPLGIAVTRLLRCKGEIRPTARGTLTRLFGTRDWYKDLFGTARRATFWGIKEATRRQRGCEAIIKYFMGRLREEFLHVSRSWLKLRNRTGSPMYLLCFASPCPKRAEIAQRILQRACPLSGPELSQLVDCD